MFQLNTFRGTSLFLDRNGEKALDDGGDGGKERRSRACRACDFCVLVHCRFIEIAEVFSIFIPPILVFRVSFLTIDAPDVHL